ncbi:MAG: hypothetical protein IT536_15860 [Hyphomicrobiales bacterium]|nr:hypothetical protein [Hyphomicrobiales bacterium]
MLDISLAGLIGAIAGTILAGVAYHLLIGLVEEAVRGRAARASDGERLELTLAVVRRTVLVADLLLFAGLGYWIGARLWG